MHGKTARGEENAISFLSLCQTAPIFHLSLTNLDNYGHLAIQWCTKL